MKKFLSFLLLLFIFSKSFSQLDREHWFAPMVDRAKTGNDYQSIYMSTNEAIPFNVDIIFNNTVVASRMLSKNNPVKYTIPSSERNRIITSNDNDLFRPVAKGFQLKGEKPFFASLRFSIKNHSEIQTSKGSAALGTEFRAVVAPITVTTGILNFMNSIMATEDNTTITINDFQPNVRFSDNITRTQFTFKLNKGQSYIIDGSGSFTQNRTGYIGAKIVSDKPIVIANGNFNGQYAGNYSNSSDILMDQGVPIDKLGQEFVLMKGNGDPSNNMERALILATENNTQIYLNNGTTPVATLNAGQYYQTTTSAYRNQGSGHYNMYIRSTKNVYVYQLLAGTNSFNGTEEATGGMNYIPPLSCYLPKKIDEIGLINENEYASNDVMYSLTVPTKLNIITEKGATISVFSNGIPLVLNASNGPFIITGNNNWVTYTIPNITGNVAIISSHAVTAGISAGNNSVGYGGYFAGFSFIPTIAKSEGDCLPNVKLQVIEGFDKYEWLIKNGTTYDPAPGVNNLNTYEPTKEGVYIVRIQQGSCPEIQTPDLKVYNCVTYTNYDYMICNTQVIVPKFAISAQSVNPSTVKIETPPTKGTVTIAANGEITYTANPNATGQDTFKYSFCGTGAIPDCETAQATINLNQIVTNIDTLTQCSTNGIATFNLSLANVSPETDLIKEYYKTKTGAENQLATDMINDFNAYVTSDTSVYVWIKNSLGCTNIVELKLKSFPAPDVNPALFTKTFCDEEIDGIIDGTYKVDLTTITPIIVSNPSTFVIKYYDTLAKANAGGTDNIQGNFSFTTNTQVWIRVESPNCPAIVKAVDLKIGTKTTLLTLEANQKICDTDLDDIEAVDVSKYIGLFTSEPSPAYKMYLTLEDAQSGDNAFTSIQNIPLGTTSFYFRISNSTTCDNIGKLNIELVKGDLSTVLKPKYEACLTSKITIDVGPGFEKGHTWYSVDAPTVALGTGQTIQLGIGKYFVDIISPNLCMNRQYFEIVELKIATNIDTLTECSTNGIATYNLSLANVSPETGLAKEYYKTKTGADNQVATDRITTFTAYTTADTSVYVRLTSTAGCTEVVEIKLKSLISPDVQANLFTKTYCDEELDGIIDGVYKADLTKITPIIVLNYNNSFIVKYYDTQAKAIAGGTDNITGIFNFTTNTKVWARIETPSCPPVITSVDLKIGKTITLLTKESTQTVCDTNLDDIEPVDVSKYIGLFTSSASPSYKMYLTLDAAKSGIGAFTDIQNIPNGITSFYFRISDPSGCDDIAILHLSMIKGNLSKLIKDEYKICKTATITIDAGSGFENGHVWYNVDDPSKPLGNGQAITLGIGKYFVELTSPNLCTNKQYFEIKEVELPSITRISIDNGTVTIYATGGNSPYSYAVDNDNYQASNVFYNVTPGLHTIKVKSADNCDPIIMEFYVIKTQNSITPNNDGINDNIDYSDLKYKTEPRFIVVDRYGKNIFDSNISKTFIWDGKFNGNALPSGSYWYILNWKEYGEDTPIQKTGWILLKNR